MGDLLGNYWVILGIYWGNILGNIEKYQGSIAEELSKYCRNDKGNIGEIVD